FREMIETNHRDLSKLQLLCGKQTAVAGDDARFGVDQNWIVKPELCDAGSNLSNLRVRVRPRILRIRNQFVDQPQLDTLCHPLQGHRNLVRGSDSRAVVSSILRGLQIVCKVLNKRQLSVAKD